MVNRWGNNGNSERLYFLGLQNHCHGDCSHEIKRRLLLERKAMTNLDSILKSRNISLPTKVRLVKAMVFPVVMCGCESWTMKKFECGRIDAFKPCCWRRCLRVPWTASRSNQSILKEINPEYALKGVVLKWKLQIFGHLMWRADSLKRPWCWQRLKVEAEGDDRGQESWMAPSNQWTWVWANSRGWWRTGKPGVLQSMGSHRVVRDWTTIGDWTQSPVSLPSLAVRGAIECSNPQGWLYWGPAPTSPWESKRCLISVTKDIFISFITGNSKGFRSSC